MSTILFIYVRFFSPTEGRYDIDNRFKCNLRKLRQGNKHSEQLTQTEDANAPSETPEMDLLDNMGISADDAVRIAAC